MNNYPRLISKTLDQLYDFCGEVRKERLNDIKDFDNLTNRFMSGRKVGKIPSASSDVDATDRIGDFNYTASYLYILVDNSGTPVWRRATLGSW